VTAKDTATQKDQRLRLRRLRDCRRKRSSAWRREADAHAAEDKTQRDAIEGKKSARQHGLTTSRRCSGLGDRFSGSDRGDVENAIADAKKALESNDKHRWTMARETLTKASHKLAEEMYKAAQATPGAGGSSGPLRRMERARSGRKRRRTAEER